MRLKFQDPDTTAKGETRATVPLQQLDTLWLNTGTLCNLACANCYIESSPQNDRLVYLTRDEARSFLDEAAALGTREIGITGGEPFLNSHILDIIGDALELGFEVLVLTNATRPMMRPRILDGLLALPQDRLTVRVSLDHFSAELHDAERGVGEFDRALEGLSWIARNGFRCAVAGRRDFGADEEETRRGYARVFSERGIPIDADDPKSLVLFAEMRAGDDPPEITNACWDILNVKPSDIMCSDSRMVVKRKGAEKPAVVSCTLLAYDERFEMGETLAEASQPVSLNHPWCATFCVLGGSSCS